MALQHSSSQHVSHPPNRSGRLLGAALALALGFASAREAHAGILFHDEFENGTGAWTLTGGWATTTSGPHSPTRSLTDTPGYNYSANASTSARIATVFDLTSAKSPRFWFWLRYSSEQFHDYLHVQTSINGVNWTTQNSFSGTMDWKRFEVNLAGYAGRPTVYVRFQVQTDAIIHNDGWYLDDFVFDDGNPAVAISAPQGGSVLAAGSDLAITFTYDGTYDPLAQSISVFYSDVNGYSTIASGLPMDTTSVPWTVPNINVAQGYVRVEVRDQYDEVLTQTVTPAFAIDSTTPSTFALTSPADQACGSATPTFDWADATDNNGVKYTLTVTPTTGAPLVKSNLSASQYTLAAGEALVSAGNPHSWSVTAVDPAGHTRTSSTTRIFQADSVAPTSFALTAPVDGTMSDGTGLVFEWNTTTDPGCGLSHYALYIDGDLCADNLAACTDSIALEMTSCAALSPGAHSWTVAAVDSFGNVGWSSASPGGNGGWSFIVLDDMTGPGAGGAGGEGGAGGAGEAGADAGGSAGTSGSGGSSGSGGTPGSDLGGAPGADGGMAGEPAGGAGEAPIGSGGEMGSGTAGSGASGTGGSSGSASSGGGNKAGSTGTMPGAGGESTEDPERSSAGSSDDGGCGCRVPVGSSQDATGLLPLLALLALRWRRRNTH